MNILILAGGLSPERDVSLTSASLIANALQRKGHKICLADIYEGFDCPYTEEELSDPEKVPDERIFTSGREYSYRISESVPSLDEIRHRNGDRRALIAPGILALCRRADVVYIGLHGDMGENGQLQATLDNFGIKYTGTGYIGSLLAMDKDLAKRVMAFDGVLTPRWERVGTGKDEKEHAFGACADGLIKNIGLPCVVKPCSCGSSVGVSMADTRDELVAALAFASLYADSVLVEEKIVGREFSISVLGDRTLPAVEIIPKSGFYDYKNKYQSDMTEEICPAPLTEAEAAEISRCALDVFRSLRLEGYARADFILSEKDGRFYCLEANTLPGMTPASLMPLEARAVGIDYDTLCDTIARLAYFPSFS